MTITLNEVGGFEIRTAEALTLVHKALRSKDAYTARAGESILSALVLVLRHERAVLPGEMLPYYQRLIGEREDVRQKEPSSH